MAFARWFGRTTISTPAPARRRVKLELHSLEGRDVPASVTVPDAGFEAAALATGVFKYNPTGTPWTYNGTAGITANNSAFTAGSPNANHGTQRAFIQGTGSVTQAVTFTAGTYVLGFTAAQRGNIPGRQTLQLLVDNTIVGTFNAIEGGVQSPFVSSSIKLTAGSHTITFKGTNLYGGDNTAFVDQISITPQMAGVSDSAFELPALTAGSFKYNPAGGPWTFAGSAGLATSGSAFTAGNPAAPQGNQVALLQGKGSFSQTINFAAGTFALDFVAAQRGNVPGRQTFQVLVDNQVVGTFNNLSGVEYSALSTSSFQVSAGNHTVTFQGTNLVGGDNTAFIDSITITQPTAGLSDSGFELPALAAGTFKYNATGGPWSFSGTSGISSNASGFTAGNADAPQGGQVAFIQRLGAFSQVTTLTAGTYAITFAASQRGNVPSAQTFQVLVDGKTVGTFNNLTGQSYTSLISSTFAASAGNHTITFQGTNLAGGDNTAFIDSVAVVRQSAGLVDSGFETPAIAFGTFRYAPSGAAWSFSGTAGVTANRSAFTAGNADAPQGAQVAFLQKNGAFSQVVNFSAGTYAISFAASQRGNLGSAQTFRVLVDGNVVGTFNNVQGNSYQLLNTSTFGASAGNHTITFQGTNLRGGDNTAFIDQVTVVQQAAGLVDTGFELPALGGPSFKYRPAGHAWTFTGDAGVAANGSTFTSGNPAAPQGDQVAFLQNQGKMSQVVNFAAGTYYLIFAAAQRSNVPSLQTFQITVDGLAIGVYNDLESRDYLELQTSGIELAAGNHTITFQATNAYGGDNTVFIDQIMVAQLA